MVSSVPNTPDNAGISPATKAIKIATPDLILTNNEEMSIEIMTDLIFEDIGGQEIIGIVRGDLVNGQSVLYQPIKNLLDIQFQYNSKNIISLEDTSENIFNNFPINLPDYIPDVGTGPNGSYIYLDEQTGDLILNLIRLSGEEQVEIQILATGELLDDTIY
jgi:hypothetical protein